MRSFVVLALMALTGCQANVLRSEQPKAQLDMVKDAFWDYVVKATKTATDALKTMKESELAQRLNPKIEHSVEAARYFESMVYDQMSFVGQESYKRVSEQVDRLSERLQLEAYAKQLRTNIEPHVEKLRQVVAPYNEFLDMKALEATYLRKIRELMQALEWRVVQLLTLLGPSTDRLQYLMEFQDALPPEVSSIGDEIMMKLYAYDRTFSPYGEDMMKKLEPYMKNLTSLWESFTKSV